MSKDITPIMQGWEFDPQKLCVRKIIDFDGREKIQRRVDMGIWQMQIDGRPDGRRPHGKESFFDYYLYLLEEHKKEQGTDEGFKLDEGAFVHLETEALQYYIRRISFFELKEYNNAKRDAERNLRVFDFVRDYAESDEYRLILENYRPFVTSHRIRADVLICLKKGYFDRAIEHIEDGIKEIENFFKSYGRDNQIDDSQEIKFLESWREDILSNKPVSARKQLERELQQAVQEEKFEKAALIRDQIKRIERQQK